MNTFCTRTAKRTHGHTDARTDGHDQTQQYPNHSKWLGTNKTQYVQLTRFALIEFAAVAPNFQMIYKHTTASRNKVMALRKQNTLIRTVVSLFGLSYGRMVICNQTSKTQHGSIFAANALKCIHVHSSQSTEIDNVHDQNRIESSNISVSLNHL